MQKSMSNAADSVPVPAVPAPTDPAPTVPAPAVPAVPESGPVKRIKKRKKRRKSGTEKSLTNAERTQILSKRAQKQLQISENMRMNAWKLACGNQNLFQKTEFHRVPSRGSDQHSKIKNAQCKILNDTWQQACKDVKQTDLAWITAEAIGGLSGVKLIDRSHDQVKLTDVMRTHAYDDVHAVCKAALKKEMAERSERSSQLVKDMWVKAVNECGAPDMLDLPNRSTNKFKKLASDEAWKTRYDNVDEQFHRLVQASS